MKFISLAVQELYCKIIFKHSACFFRSRFRATKTKYFKCNIFFNFQFFFQILVSSTTPAISLDKQTVTSQSTRTRPLWRHQTSKTFSTSSSSDVIKKNSPEMRNNRKSGQISRRLWIFVQNVLRSNYYFFVIRPLFCFFLSCKETQILDYFCCCLQIDCFALRKSTYFLKMKFWFWLI